jgi:lipopolysaccharide biosynthesis protein
MKVTSVAIYLPQFHPIPENNLWWGKGFTEWTNVTKAKPLFKGHYQPHLPADLGFYDLRLEESRLAQEELAKKFGIGAFCYYHYWFNGKKLLDEPLRRKLVNVNETLPFMICWANENWTRVWDGSINEVLMEQNYSEEDDINHIMYLMEYLKDSRYLKFNGKHVVAIYKSELIPNAKRTIEIWRECAKREGIDLLICRMDAHGKIGEQFLSKGFDRSIDFQPFGYYFESFKKEKNKNNLFNRIQNKFYRIIMNKQRFETFISLKSGVYDYEEYVNFYLNQPKLPDSCFPSLTPSWDNTARRRKNFLVLKNSTPEVFYKWLKHILKGIESEETLIFINAWNEWAEGNHLEPCQKWGTQYLEEFSRAIKEHNEDFI